MAIVVGVARQTSAAAWASPIPSTGRPRRPVATPPRTPPHLPWQGYFYYIFGFAFLVSILTMIITIEVSIVCTYVQVGACAGQPRLRSGGLGGVCRGRRC